MTRIKISKIGMTFLLASSIPNELIVDDQSFTDVK